ncbi:MAG: hypothetical protein H8E62_01755 [Planctomycetes bacterium]|nr:hypothetical protein [Planctomycetota bacterium]
MKTTNKTNRIKESSVNNLLAQRDRMLSETTADSDFIADSLMDSIYESPLGRLLKVISTLPEVRYEKVEHARNIIDQPEDELDSRMEMALDKVLEDLLIEG